MLTKLEIQRLIQCLDSAVNENIKKIKEEYSKLSSYQQDKFDMIGQVCKAISENQILRDKLVQMLEDNHSQS